MEDNNDPFSLWSRDVNAPREDDQHRTRGLYEESTDENGEIKIQIFPSIVARQSAAVIAGQFQALLDTRKFTREEAFKIVLESMSAVVIHHGELEEENDD